MAGFLPDVLVAQTLKKLGIQNEKLERELPKMVEKGLQRLYNLQHTDGGWGWWGMDDTHPFMTAYVVYGLSMAKAAGFEVDRNVYERGIDSLKMQVSELSLATSFGGRSLTPEDVNDTKVYILFSLAMAGSPLEKETLAIYQQVEHSDEVGADKLNNNYSLSLLALTLKNIGKMDLAKKVVERLIKNAVKSDIGTHWKGSTWHYSWTSNLYEATAFSILALSQIDLANNGGLISDAIRYLVVNRRGEGWLSTKDTAAVVFALADYVSRSSELTPNYTAEVRLNEKSVKKFQVSQKDAFSEGTVLTMPEDALISGDNILQFIIDGIGRLYYTANLKFFNTQPVLPATSHGIAIKRAYSNTEAEIGEDIEVTLEITSDAYYQYAVVEDFLPSGCSVAEGRSSSGEYARREIHDEKMVFLMTYLPPGTHKLSYTLHAEMPGNFVVLPANVYLMYEPDVRGNSEELGLTVR